MAGAMYLAGSGIVCLWIVGWMWRIRGMRERATMVVEGPLFEQFMGLCARLDLGRRVDLYVSEEKVSPMAFGLFRGKVILPSSMVAALSEGQMGGILAHELAHLRRWDLWVIALENLLLMLWWFNPVYWLVVRALRREREDCCDDLVLHVGAASHEGYCESLVRAASSLAGFGVRRPAVGTAEMLHPLGRRMKRIMDVTMRRAPGLSAAGLAGVLMLGAAVLPGIRGVEAEDEAVPSAPEAAAKAWAPEGFGYLFPELEPGPYRVYGKVLDEEGAPAGGVKVGAFRGEICRWGYRETLTREDGSYEIAGLPVGAYQVSALGDKALD